MFFMLQLILLSYLHILHMYLYFEKLLTHKFVCIESTIFQSSREAGGVCHQGCLGGGILLYLDKLVFNRSVGHNSSSWSLVTWLSWLLVAWLGEHKLYGRIYTRNSPLVVICSSIYTQEIMTSQPM